MKEKESQGPAKRAKIGECVDLVEQDELGKQAEHLKKVEMENKELREAVEDLKGYGKAMEELKGMVECPVCQNVPRHGGPVPVCSNGHFLCVPCRDRIRQEAGVVPPKCPSCMVDLGNGTSLLASRLLEKVKHECKEEGCEEMFSFHDLEKHERVCLFRKVLCPSSNFYCSLEMPFNKVEEHVMVCNGFNKTIDDNNTERTLTLPQTSKGNDNLATWPTKTISAHGRKFFFRTKRENKNFYSETVMLGSEDECKDFLAYGSIRDKDNKVFTMNASRPRPISLEKWGSMGLVIPEDILSKIWTFKQEKNDFRFTLRCYVEKV